MLYANSTHHYHRWPEDIKLMQELGLDAYRYSIAWPRIIPQGRGAVNEKGLDFYERLTDGLLAAGIQPWVTLYHWDLPQALEDQGGWTNRDTAYAYAEYAEVVARRLGDRVAGWITHNEPWVAAFLGYLFGEHAPGLRDLPSAMQATHHLLLSHGLAVPRLRTITPNVPVGITLNLSPAYPASDSAEDQAAAHRSDGFGNRLYLDPLFRGSYPEDTLALAAVQMPVQAGDMDAIRAPLDFVGVNYYFRQVVKHNPDSPYLQSEPVKPEGEYTTMDWEVYPDGLRTLLERLHRDYPAVPAYYITENGSAFPDEVAADGRVHDDRRRAYLESHFAAAAQAMAAGVPLRGYFVWSLLDNFEWGYGYSQRFGIIRVDYETQQRTLKDSARWYQQFLQGRSANALAGAAGG